MSCSKSSEKIKDEVREYYGKTLQSSGDLKTNVCTFGAQARTKNVREVIGQIHPKVVEKFYGCGIPIPEAIEGARVLDFGSGSGRDCFVLSKLVGQNGTVTGIDMTEEQVSTAREYIEYHTKLFGFTKPNVEFVQGFIEDLTASGLKPNFYDVVISNCVVNLSPDKQKVIEEAYNILKNGGEFYFSDVFVDVPLSQDLKDDEILRGECISGAFEWHEFVESVAQVHFSKPRLVSSHVLDITNEKLKQQLGCAKFVSATFRLLKVPLEQETPHLVEYLGTVPEFEKTLPFDKQITFKTGEKESIDSSLLSFLKSSRFEKHFKFIPSDSLFPIEVCLNPFDSDSSASSGKSCCKPEPTEPSCCQKQAKSGGCC